jgi:quercetin dioxygenase-like cupin family protein
MAEIKVARASEAVKTEAEWGRMCWYASAQIGNSATMMVGRCELNPGHGTPRHYHTNAEEVLHVVQGTVAHTLGDGEVTLEAGDTICVPPNIVHLARNIGPGTAILAISFSHPRRETIFV